MTENAKAPRVAELVENFSPGASYKVMDEGKAHLAHALEKMCVAESRSPGRLAHVKLSFPRLTLAAQKFSQPRGPCIDTSACRYNMEEMFVEQRDQQGSIVKRVINHTFDVYPKLNSKIQEHYDRIFGKPKKHTRTGEAETPKTPLPFGFGAFRSHRFGTDDGKRCALQ